MPQEKESKMVIFVSFQMQLSPLVLLSPFYFFGGMFVASLHFPDLFDYFGKRNGMLRKECKKFVDIVAAKFRE
jgi:hypothetical protein